MLAIAVRVREAFASLHTSHVRICCVCTKRRVGVWEHQLRNQRAGDARWLGNPSTCEAMRVPAGIRARR